MVYKIAVATVAIALMYRRLVSILRESRGLFYQIISEKSGSTMT